MYKRRALLIGAGLLASVVALAPAGATNTGKQQQGAHPNSIAPKQTFTTGKLGGTKVVITNHGNVLGFQSPTSSPDFEHINNGGLSEGYILCYGGIDAYDTGMSEFGFKPSNVITFPSANKMKLVRNTSDLAMQLTSELTFIPKEGKLTIKNTVTNNSLSDQNDVVFRRQVDFDTNNTQPDYWARTSDQVMAWDDSTTVEEYGMALRDLGSTPGLVRTTKVTDAVLDSSCNPTSEPTPTAETEDFGGTIQYDIGTLHAGQSVSATVSYERL
jgi:hypothetical protein